MYPKESLFQAYEKSLEQHAMVSRTDADGIITHVNKYFCALTGYTEQELVGQKHELLKSGVHSNVLFEQMSEELRAGRSWWGTLKQIGKAGNPFWVDAHVTPIVTENNEVIGYLCIQYDVNSQQRTSENIKSRETQLRMAQEIAKIGSWTYDVREDKIYWSDQMFEIFHRKKEEGVPTPREHYDSVHTDDKDIWKKTVFECMEKGGQYSIRFRVVHDDGITWIEAQGSTKQNPDGTVRVLLGTCQDITNQVLMNEQLKSTQNLLRTILDFMPGPVYSKDKQGKYLFVNRSFIESVNMKVDDPIGKDDFEIFDRGTASELRANDKMVVELRQLQEKREKVPHPDGTLREYESYKFPIFDHSDDIASVTGISFDITEKNKMKHELELERARLIQASKMTSLGEMAGGIAHEINNPLAIIEGFTKRLQSEVYEVDGELAHKVRRISSEILKAVGRTGDIISGLRNFARDASNEKYKKVLVKKIIDDTYSLCRSRFSECNVELILEACPFEEIECQEVQISQVLLNLLGNALDATVDSKIPRDQRKVKISAGTCQLNGYSAISFKVQDEGVGFNEEAVDRSLEPFYSTKDAGKGTGLGLSISKGLIEKHGGELRIARKSHPTIVEVVIPSSQENRQFYEK